MSLLISEGQTNPILAVHLHLTDRNRLIE